MSLDRRILCRSVMRFSKDAASPRSRKGWLPEARQGMIHAANHHHDTRTRHRPWLPVAQTSGIGADLRPELRPGPCLLPRSRSRALYGRPAAGHRFAAIGPDATPPHQPRLFAVALCQRQPVCGLLLPQRSHLRDLRDGAQRPLHGTTSAGCHATPLAGPPRRPALFRGRIRAATSV
jgi:hypothetical protein